MKFDLGLHLVRISSNFNSSEYAQILANVFSSNNLADQFILHQDNCSLYLGPEVKDFFSNSRVKVLKTPPASPDLNPIENVWYLIDRKLSSFLLTNLISVIYFLMQ